MNQASEQLTTQLTIERSIDTPLTTLEMCSRLCFDLPGAVSRKENGIHYVDYRVGSKNIIILVKACTYLGNPHPVFKKRIQIPKTWKDFAINKEKNQNIEVLFLGVYHYKGLVIYINFKKEPYLRRQMNNSSAHVYTNDLLQALQQGVAVRVDKNGNEVTAIHSERLCNYLHGQAKSAYEELFNFFQKFNKNFVFGRTLTAMDAIQEMKTAGWSQWRQAEWPGFYLEYKVSSFLDANPQFNPHIIFTKLKAADSLDFDLKFPIGNFVGDLKASSDSEKKTPGNDSENIAEALKQYRKIWYVIYEHATVKDRDLAEKNFEATRFWNQLLEKENPLSYKDRMKHDVIFKRMFILELNPVNAAAVLNDFKQGRQASGAVRNLKKLINKSTIDNFIIFSYSNS